MSRHKTIAVSIGVLAGVCVGSLLWNGGNTLSVEFPDSGPDMRLGDDVPAFTTAADDWLNIALTDIAVRGYTAENIERVASELSDERAQALRVAAMIGLAERDLRSAIAFALSLDSLTAQTVALQRVAGVAAHSDPEDAVDLAGLISVAELREAYSRQALADWAVRDPAGLFAHLDRHGVPEWMDDPGALEALAAADSGRLLATMHQLPRDMREPLERAAIEAVLAIDAGSAYAFANSLPPSLGTFPTLEREQLLAQIASSHALVDPQAALAQLLAVSAPPPNAVQDALRRVDGEAFDAALRDSVERSMEMLAMAEDRVTWSDRLGMLVTVALERESPAVGEIVEQISNHPSLRVRNALNGRLDMANMSVLARWAEHDPGSAVAWAVRNPSIVSPAVLQHLGSVAAGADFDSGGLQQTLYGLPEDLRGYWVAGVAEGLAASDLEAALKWLEPMRGAPVYSTATQEVLSSAVSTRPAAVASALASLPDTADSHLVMRVAQSWAVDEPALAGEWLAASGNIDDWARVAVTREVVRNWAGRDPEAATAWARNLSSDSLRDAALEGVVQTALADGDVNTNLFAEFSSDTALAETLVGAMNALRRTDPDLGRLLIDQYIANSEQRRLAELKLAGQAPPEPIRTLGGVPVR